MVVAVRGKSGVQHYGCEHLGRLTSVLLHAPLGEDGLPGTTPADLGQYRAEHLRYRKLLEDYGVRTYELAEAAGYRSRAIRRLPHLVHLHDAAVITRRGAILSQMPSAARRGEPAIVRAALQRLGIPVWIDFDDPQDAFSGCHLLGQGLAMVVEAGGRRVSVFKFIRECRELFPEIIYLDHSRFPEVPHQDMVFNRITPALAVGYLPALQNAYRICRGTMNKIDIKLYFQSLGIEIVAVSDEEQRRQACSFVALDSGVLLQEEGALGRETRRKLEKRGVSFVLFPARALLAGGGSLRRLTLRLHRQAESGLLAPLDMARKN